MQFVDIMNCEYCNNTFSNVSSLKNHQRKAKYCLEIQGKKLSAEYACEFCNNIFTSKCSLQYHHDICKANISLVIIELKNEKKLAEKYKSENILLKKEIETLLNRLTDFEKRDKELREDYSKLTTIAVKKSTTTINNNTINLGVFDKTPDDIKRIVDENYNKQYLVQGQKGVAIFTSKHVLNKDSNESPIYVITDRSRGNGKYKISENEFVTDTGMSGLTKKVQPSIKNKAVYIIGSEPNIFENEDLLSGYHEVVEMDQDNSTFRNCLVKELTHE